MDHLLKHPFVVPTAL